MVTQETLQLARTAAKELRQRGEHARAAAIDALVNASRDDTLPSLDLLTSSEAGDVLGVTGQTIKNWVRQGRLRGYRVGSRIMVPKDVVTDYVRRARGSLDLDEVSDEEAADLVAEGRRKG
jgi:excisionase family DNA binding protein